MNLIDRIIEAALDDAKPIGSLLRMCLVLAHRLKNEELKLWTERELDGYRDLEMEDIPEYRVVRSVAKGLMLGPYGKSIKDQPIPAMILDEIHRFWADTVYLTQPIGSYDMKDTANGKGKLVIEWPANLVVLYQNKIMPGYTLNRAYQELPESCIVGLIENVRNRVLKLVLELKDQPRSNDGDKPEDIPEEKLRHFVTNIIYGGQNVIGSTTQNVQQIGDITIPKGDLNALRAALSQIGVSKDEAASLEAALEEDINEKGDRAEIGPRVKSWMDSIVSGGAKAGGQISISLITAAVCKYLGIG